MLWPCLPLKKEVCFLMGDSCVVSVKLKLMPSLSQLVTLKKMFFFFTFNLGTYESKCLLSVSAEYRYKYQL